MLVGETGKPQYPWESRSTEGKKTWFSVGKGTGVSVGKKKRTSRGTTSKFWQKNENFGKFLIFQVIVARLTRKTVDIHLAVFPSTFNCGKPSN